MREELYGDSKLEDLQEFRYLGEMLLLGAAVLAVVTCCWCAWGKSGQQLPLLTNHYLPLLNQGWVYSTSGRSQVKPESETWVMTTETLKGLWHTDCGILTAMIPWICYINMKRKAWWLGLLSLLKQWFCCC